MSIELARQLHEAGKVHAWASCLLYSASIEYAEDENYEDPQAYASNGTPSQSTHYLLGLGLELMLKSIIVASNPNAVDDQYLRITVGRDLIKALDDAEGRGFESQAPHLRDLIELVHGPYKQQWFRYERPVQMPLPGDFGQIIETLAVFEDEVAAKLAVAENSC